MFPHEFNQLVTRGGFQGSCAVERHAATGAGPCGFVRADAGLRRQATLVVCDKHGGRNRYDELISQHFDDQFVFRLKNRVKNPVPHGDR